MYKLIALLAITLVSSECLAYDVDWDPNHPSNLHILRITVDGCTTNFKVPDKEFYKFTESDKALNDALDIAIERAKNGCN